MLINKMRKALAILLVFSMIFSGQMVSVNTKAKVKPVKPKIKQAVSKKAGELKITYKKVSKQIKYQIQVSTNSKFKKVTQNKTVKGNGTTTTFKKLKAASYYVRMRSFVTEKKKKKYSAWSTKCKVHVIGTKKKDTSDTDKNNTATSTPENTPVPSEQPSDAPSFMPTVTPSKEPTAVTSAMPSSTPGSTAGTDGSGKDNASTGDNGSSDNNGKDQMSTDLSDYLLNIHITYISSRYNKTTNIYNGQPQCPEVSVESRYGDVILTKDTDYTVTYKNNVNAGTAQVQVTGKGKYTGELTGTFEIEKAMPQVHYGSDEAAAGSPLPVVFNVKQESQCTYEVYDWKTDEQVDVKINENGEAVPISSGIIGVKVKVPESQNIMQAEYDLGKITVCDEENPESGFSDTYYYQGDTPYKSGVKTATAENGKATFNVSFESNASDSWINRHIRFEAEDVTPTAYKKAFQWLEQDMTAPTVTDVESTTKELRADSYYGRKEIVGSCVDRESDYTGDTGKKCLSSQKLTVTAGLGVRAIKIKAYRDDKLYDVVYIAPNPCDAQENEIDEELYAAARHKVEAKIWTDDMTNLEKLNTLASYIRTTTHYPGTGSVSKEKNPTFWNSFAVDGIELFYDMYNTGYTMVTLNRIMLLQGGITTCVGVRVVQKAATDDLGLPNLYDSSTGSIASGEGVWVARGSYSSNPYVASHESVIYKDANEKKYFIDAQGMITDTPCEEHGCLDKVIRD